MDLTTAREYNFPSVKTALSNPEKGERRVRNLRCAQVKVGNYLCSPREHDSQILISSGMRNAVKGLR
jgi:hypothetical protein